MRQQGRPAQGGPSSRERTAKTPASIVFTFRFSKTDASGDTVYLDGNLSALGLGQHDWAANGIPMTRVSATKWTVANRNFGFNAADATYTASDTVAAWAGIGSC